MLIYSLRDKQQMRIKCLNIKTREKGSISIPRYPTVSVPDMLPIWIWHGYQFEVTMLPRSAEINHKTDQTNQ